MGWQAGARLVILAGDAPCHGAYYHVGCHASSTCHCDDATSRASMHADPQHTEKLVARMATGGIDFYFLEILPAQTSRMGEVFRTAFNTAPSPADGSRRCFSIQDMSAHGAATKIGITIASLAKVSVESSKCRASASVSAVAMRGALRSAAGGGKGSRGVSTYHHYGPTKDLKLPLLEEGSDEDNEDADSSHRKSRARTLTSLVKSPICWENLSSTSVERAVRHSFISKPGEDIDWAKLDLKHIRQETHVRICPSFFDAGAMRTAHIMRDANLPERRLVAKVYKKSPQNVQKQLEQDVVTQAVSKMLARAYSTQPMLVPVAVDFIFTCYYELLDRPKDDPFRFMAAEPYIVGTYKKYSNNNGWVSKDFSQTAAAFTHFTWQVCLYVFRHYGILI